MRSVKTAEEIEELERAAVIGYKMHTPLTMLQMQIILLKTFQCTV